MPTPPHTPPCTQEDSTRLARDIANRLKGLREAMDWTPETMAARCGVPVAEVLAHERGDTEVPASYLVKAAQAAGVDLTDLLTGHEAHLRRWTLVRKGEGLPVTRRKDYGYRALADRFTHRAMEPFLVTTPARSREDVSYNQHPGQEFLYLLEGRMEVLLDQEAVVMGPHDSLYFNALIPHAMRGLDGEAATFLDVII